MKYVIAKQLIIHSFGK